MLIYYCISLMILLTMLMTGIVNPICSFLIEILKLDLMEFYIQI